MFLYSVIVAVVIIVSSAAFAYFLHRHKSLDINTLAAVIITSLFVFALSMFFPFLFAAIVNLISRGTGIYRIAAGISVALLVYLILVTKFVSFVISYVAERKADTFSHNTGRSAVGYLIRLVCEIPGRIGNRWIGYMAKNSGPRVATALNDIGSEGTTVIESTSSGAEAVEENMSKPEAGIPEDIISTLEFVAAAKEDSIPEADAYNCAAVQTEEIKSELGAPDAKDSDVVPEPAEIIEYTDMETAETEVEEFAAKSEEDKASAEAEESEEIENTEEIEKAKETEEVEEKEDKEEIEEAEKPEEVPETDEHIESNTGDTTTEIDEGQAVGEVIQLSDNTKTDIGMDADKYIEEAFRFKEKGDFESAILYYMYALDKKPEDELVFWIILDICVLYKEMGQAGLAKEILESYVEAYGHVMDPAIRLEIEKNLV